MNFPSNLRACLLAPVVAVACIGADWPRFRGPDGNAVSSDKNVPLTWSSTENIAWKTPLPGPGASCPIVVGERIFLTCYSGYGIDPAEPGDRSELTLHVVCLDRATGQVRWDRAMPASPQERSFQGQVTNHGYATPTPVSDGQAVFAFFGPSGVVAYDVDGELLWRADVGSGTAGFGFAASPILYDNLVIVNASIESKRLVALDKKTGQTVWEADDIARAWNTPILVDSPEGRAELVVNRIDFMLGFDPASGAKLWSCGGIADYICPSMVAHEGIIYALGGRVRQAMAVRPGGRGDVTVSHKLWQTKSGANVTSPVFHQGHLYFLDDRGVFHCVDAATGQIVYRERLRAGNRVYPSCVLAGGRLYCQTREAGTFVIEPSPEGYKQLAHNVIEDDDSLFNASPAVHDGQLLLRSDRYLYCIGNR